MCYLRRYYSARVSSLVQLTTVRSPIKVAALSPDLGILKTAVK